MSDTTITPEERALWRKMFDSPFFDKGCKPFSLRALDALEDSERRVSELTVLLDASCEETRQNFSALYKTATEVIPALNAKIEQAEARAERAEAMVDWLAEKCAMHCRDKNTDDSQCSISNCGPVHCRHASADQWKEAARLAVADAEREAGE